MPELQLHLMLPDAALTIFIVSFIFAIFVFFIKIKVDDGDFQRLFCPNATVFSALPCLCL